MSVNIVEDSDADFVITEKLNSTGRISLSDITAATIGPLDEATWEGGQSEELNHETAMTVHRPWADMSESGTDQIQVLPSTDNLPTENLTKTKIEFNDTPSHETVISIDPLVDPQPKRKLENDDRSFEKRIKMDAQTLKFEDKSDLQMISGHNSKQFDFSAPAQTITGPDNYNGPTSAVKTEPVVNLEHNIPDVNPISASFRPTSGLIQPWSHVSIPVSNFTNTEHRPSATYSNPESVYQMPRFQPWVNNSELNPYTEMTPIKKSASVFDSQSMNILKQPQVLSTPMNERQVNFFDCKTSLNSPMMESRFNDSLSNLLGSPHTGSPISNNPFFSALQSALESDCKKEIVPQTLMDIHPGSFGRDNIFTRERLLNERFNALQQSSPDEVRQLSGFYRYQSALIETERFRTLHECKYPLSYKDTVNKLFDDKLHSIMDRVEQSVLLLENANKENKVTNKGGKPRPHLNKEAVKIFENWYQQNLDHPYPTSATYDLLALKGNVAVEQVKKWFANKRNRTHNTRTLTEIAMKKRKLNLMSE